MTKKVELDEDSIAGFADQQDGKGTADTAGSTGTSQGDAAPGGEKKEQLVQKETRHVLMLRLLVCLILMLAALLVSFVVYRITAQNEVDQFQVQFQGAASKVTDAFLDIANQKIGSAGALVVALEAHGIDHFKNWPFVTLSSFQRRATAAKQLSGALFIGINPLVSRAQRAEWENYSLYSDNNPDSAWYAPSIEYQNQVGIMELDVLPQIESDDAGLNFSTGIANHIYSLPGHAGAKATISANQSQYLPDWQMSPISRQAMINQDRSSNTDGLWDCLTNGAVVFGGLKYSRPGYATDTFRETSEMAWLLSMTHGTDTKYQGDLFSTVYLPLNNNFDDDHYVVGAMRLVIHWARFFRGILPEGLNGVVMVLDNFCDEPYTYVINGARVKPIGVGDLHDRHYDYMEQVAHFQNISSISDGTTKGMDLFHSACPIHIRIYPSKSFEDEFRTSAPTSVTIAVACVFLFAIMMFFVYDRLVERRQRLILRKAEQTNAIVSSLFPKNVRDRMLDDKAVFSTCSRFKTRDSVATEDEKLNAPIADLFPDATIMFCDISGFTAWSSSRDPTHVFQLLGAIYQAFDKIALRRCVFKVETIGDSYVAVTGLPEAQPRHAVIMARFAAECMIAMQNVVRTLETTLGPDTAELTMRFGLHSGPVTAGVLQGEKSRFQLFGDSVNTAARMESTGLKNRIQCSKATADLLKESGKTHWIHPRADVVYAKGLGSLQTFWVTPWCTKGEAGSDSDEAAGNDVLDSWSAPRQGDDTESTNTRLVSWMTELLKTYIKDIVAKRDAVGQGKKASASTPSRIPAGARPLDEVVELINLPQFDEKAVAALGHKGCQIQIPAEISALLFEYVWTIAAAYNDINPFHNFSHACHVAMSVDKFLKRIVAPDIEISQLKQWREGTINSKDIASKLHDYTHGINSDPVALFAMVFGALIHDVDHRGVSNAQLCKEELEMAHRFEGKSVAEQHSLNLAWNRLMSPKFDALRSYVFASEEELQRFRQIIVNTVLATDIFDKELNDLRRSRWEKAFAEHNIYSSKMEVNGLRATIVLEHIIQASDVSHCMQHWHVYTKWNRRLFQEMTLAHRAGRTGVDPASFWYQGELGFFDNYVIPLALKLKECKVFGVNSDQCLVYAIKNREEWQTRGKVILAEMVEEVKSV